MTRRGGGGVQVRRGMSKSNATSAKSLEEIIASIRKSLTGDAGGSARGASAKPDRIEPELGPPGDLHGQNALPQDGLSDRLAGALNGQAPGEALDDDLADILAQDAPKSDPAQPGAGSGKDGLWFLGRGKQGETDAAPAPAARAAAGEPIKLSRPEILRAALPPLFGAEADQAPSPRMAAEVPKPIETVLSTARTQPLHAPAASGEKHAKGVGDTVLTVRTEPRLPIPPPDETRPAETKTEPHISAVPPAAVAEPEKPGVSVAEPVRVETTPPTTPPPASVQVQDAAVPRLEAQPASPIAEAASGDAAETPEPSTAQTASTRTLEQVIGEVLDPVIRHWLATNLPGMVEKVVREEVARVVATERVPSKV